MSIETVAKSSSFIIPNNAYLSSLRTTCCTALQSGTDTISTYIHNQHIYSTLQSSLVSFSVLKWILCFPRCTPCWRPPKVVWKWHLSASFTMPKGAWWVLAVIQCLHWMFSTRVVNIFSFLKPPQPRCHFLFLLHNLTRALHKINFVYVNTFTHL